jgi:hypothetical protein
MGGARQLAAVVTAAVAIGSCLGAVPAAVVPAGRLSPTSGLVSRDNVMVASKTAGQQESSRPAERNGPGAEDAQEKDTRPQRGALLVEACYVCGRSSSTALPGSFFS